jgi:hypothetical protein
MGRLLGVFYGSVELHGVGRVGVILPCRSDLTWELTRSFSQATLRGGNNIHDIYNLFLWSMTRKSIYL